MIKLGDYIHTLLNSHPEVDVPGIGLFKKERIPARFDKESQSFIPPRFKVILQANNSDGRVLLSAIASRERVSEEEAKNSLDLSISKLLADLEEQATATLDGIGYLQYAEGALTLTAAEKIQAGMAPVSELPIREELPIEVVQPVEETVLPTKGDDDLIEEAIVEEEYLREDSHEQEIEEATVVEEPADTDYPEDREELADKKKSSVWVWLLTVIIVAGIGTGWWYYNNQQEQSNKETIAKADSLKADSLKADSLVQKAKTDSVEAARMLVVQTDSLHKRDSLLDDSVSKVMKGVISYEIIVASLPNIPMAEEYVSRMNKLGHHTRVILSKMPGNLKKVSCGSYLRKEEADAALVQVQRSFAKEAWIARIKH